MVSKSSKWTSFLQGEAARVFSNTFFSVLHKHVNSIVDDVEKRAQEFVKDVIMRMLVIKMYVVSALFVFLAVFAYFIEYRAWSFTQTAALFGIIFFILAVLLKSGQLGKKSKK